MNKAQLVDKVALEANLTKVDAKKAVEAFVNVTSNALKEGDKISLVGFGSFSINKRTEREGINPQTKQKITIPAKNVVKFKAGSELSQNVQ